MAEQLALQQLVGEGAAEQRDERLGGARSLVVERAGDEFLAGPRLALDQDGRVRVEHAAQGLEQPLHGRAGAQDLGEPVAVARLGEQAAVLVAERGLAAGGVECDGGLVGHGAQEGQVVPREPPPRADRVQVHRPDLPGAQPQRHARDGLDVLQHDALYAAVALVGLGLVDQHRLTRPQDLLDDARGQRPDARQVVAREVAAGADLERGVAATVAFQQHEAALGPERVERGVEDGVEDGLGLARRVEGGRDLGEGREGGGGVVGRRGGHQEGTVGVSWGRGDQ